jgi:hypothetical protein
MCVWQEIAVGHLIDTAPIFDQRQPIVPEKVASLH